MFKPVVEYSSAHVELGKRGIAYIITPHPVLGEVRAPKWVHTTAVLVIDDKGFETENTRYNKSEIHNVSIISKDESSV